MRCEKKRMKSHTRALASLDYRMKRKNEKRGERKKWTIIHHSASLWSWRSCHSRAGFRRQNRTFGRDQLTEKSSPAFHIKEKRFQIEVGRKLRNWKRMKPTTAQRTWFNTVKKLFIVSLVSLFASNFQSKLFNFHSFSCGATALRLLHGISVGRNHVIREEGREF